MVCWWFTKIRSIIFSFLVSFLNRKIFIKCTKKKMLLLKQKHKSNLKPSAINRIASEVKIYYVKLKKDAQEICYRYCVALVCAYQKLSIFFLETKSLLVILPNSLKQFKFLLETVCVDNKYCYHRRITFSSHQKIYTIL